MYYETSAIENLNVKEVFEYIIKQICNMKISISNNLNINPDTNDSKSEKSCAAVKIYAIKL